jgi:hypothetical protein
MHRSRQATIYIGLNDSISKEQKFDTKRYVSLLKNVCQSYHVAFSMSEMTGGYFHDDGTYVEENTLVLMMLDVPDAVVQEIATDLCTFFHQESVMVTYSDADVHFVKETIEI